MSASFGKRFRLRSPHQFQAILSPGAQRLSQSPFLLLRKANLVEHPRLGVIVPNRHCPSLAQRNLVKRLIRESFRLQRERLPAADVAVLLRQRCDKMSRRSLRDALDSLWQRLRG